VIVVYGNTSDVPINVLIELGAAVVKPVITTKVVDIPFVVLAYRFRALN